uniref:Uncharacterized protein n=1 Tax=Romanomermis culicivorax TaxID=13658 RepID=A0A915HN85_ROMCU
MPLIRYIGNRDILANGKGLLETLTQLKNFGVGRMVTKNEWQRRWPDQPSYCIVKKVECEMDRWLRFGKVYGDFVYRGKPMGVIEFSHALDRADWRLIHKHDEENFRKCDKPFDGRKIPKNLPLPPLLRHLYQKKHAVDGKLDEVKLPMIENAQYVDIEHEIFRKCTELCDDLSPKPDGSIYDVDKEIYLDLYGKELPFKVEKWTDDENGVYKLMSSA